MPHKNETQSNKIYTVSEINQLIRVELESTFPSLWVEGEISNFHLHSSGHSYFTLKDEQSQLRAVMFRQTVQSIPFQVQDGLQVICKGHITVYPPRGEYQIIVEIMEPKGKGALQLAFEQLKEKLAKEGLFDSKYKKPLPFFPKKIGIVTSPEGAAIRDILIILERRFARLAVVIYPAKVQGEGAAEEIIEGIEYFNTLQDIDVIIISRGGGSVEDLWAFNNEGVARAIFQSRIPIVSAVGHEIDYTIADFVADIRAPTPSAAAEIVVDKEESFQEKISHFQLRMHQAMRLIFEQKKNTALHLVKNESIANFPSRLQNINQRVDELEMRGRLVMSDWQRSVQNTKSNLVLLAQKMGNGMKRTYVNTENCWQNLVVQLNNLSPLSILRKGYSLCWKKEKSILVKEAGQVEVEEEIKVTLYKGEITCCVQEVDEKKSWPEPGRIH